MRENNNNNENNSNELNKNDIYSYMPRATEHAYANIFFFHFNSYINLRLLRAALKEYINMCVYGIYRIIYISHIYDNDI